MFFCMEPPNDSWDTLICNERKTRLASPSLSAINWSKERPPRTSSGVRHPRHQGAHRAFVAPCQYLAAHDGVVEAA